MYIPNDENLVSGKDRKELVQDENQNDTKRTKKKRKKDKKTKQSKEKLQPSSRLDEDQEKDRDSDRLQHLQDTEVHDDSKAKKKEKKLKKKKKRDRDSVNSNREQTEDEKKEENETCTKRRKRMDGTNQPSQDDTQTTLKMEGDTATRSTVTKHTAPKIVASSAVEFYQDEIKETKIKQPDQTITLLLFYQYVEPQWDEGTYNFMLQTLKKVGDKLRLTGRMRVAKEGLNCTLTGSHSSILQYCQTLQKIRPHDFQNTEFKLTQDLPKAQAFPQLKVFPVVELVHYGLEGAKAPPIRKYSGTHLEPREYHQKIAEENTVIIDVRNHYEAAIGRFVPPSEDPTTNNDEHRRKDHANALNSERNDTTNQPPKWLDPKMRKSTEFPVWLDKPETKELMKGKQVLMYCTGTYSRVFECAK